MILMNINRDFLIILDVKTGEVDSPNIYYFNTDKNTSNLYVQMVLREPSVAIPINNATDYSIKANILKPNMVGKEVEGTLVNPEKAIYEFKLPSDCTDFSGNAKIEFEVYTGDKIVTSFATKFKVIASILSEQNKYIEDSSDYPILKQLIEEVRELQANGGTGTGTGTSGHTHSNKTVLDGITAIKINSWDTAYTHSQSTHFNGNYNNLTDKPIIPTNTSQLINDSGFITEGSIDFNFIDDTTINTNKTWSSSKIDSLIKGQILPVTQSQYDSLISGETISIDGVDYVYNENTIYGITDATESSGTFNGVLTSPNGTEYVLKVDDDGNLSASLRPVLCTGVSLNKSSLTFNTNSTQTLVATFTPSNTSETKVWSSDNTSIATVDNGVITPVSNGQCNIIITCGNQSASCSVVIDMPIVITDFTNYAYNTDTYINPSESSGHPNYKTYYLTFNVGKTVSDGVLTLTKKDGIESGTNAYLIAKVNTADNNVYYYRALVKTNYAGLKAGRQGNNVVSVPNDNEWHLVSFINTDSNTTSYNYQVDMNTFNAGETVEVKELMKINLTEIYGSGNEPSDVSICDSTFTTYKTGLVG